MGHIRLGDLPRTRRWKQVIGLLLDEGSSFEDIAKNSLYAIELGLESASYDNGLNTVFWLMTQLTDSAAKSNFVDRLSSKRLDIPDQPTFKVLLVALGVRPDGNCEVINFPLARSESAACWWGFVSDLKQRGLTGQSLEVIVTDGAGGLLSALDAHYPRVARQRCVFHKVMDMKPYLVKKGRSPRIIGDAFHIFEAKTVTEAGKRLSLFTDRWHRDEPRAVRSLHRDFGDCLTFLAYNHPVRTRLKMNNTIERYIQEIERRTVPMRSFNNTSSAETIIYGIIAYVINHKQDTPLKTVIRKRMYNEITK